MTMMDMDSEFHDIVYNKRALGYYATCGKRDSQLCHSCVLVSFLAYYVPTMTGNDEKNVNGNNRKVG